MSKDDASEAVRIYRVFVQQVEQVSRYLAFTQDHVRAAGITVPTIRTISIDLTSRLQEYCVRSHCEAMKSKHPAQAWPDRRPGTMGSDAAPQSSFQSVRKLQDYRETSSARLLGPFNDSFDLLSHDALVPKGNSLRHLSSAERSTGTAVNDHDPMAPSGVDQTKRSAWTYSVEPMSSHESEIQETQQKRKFHRPFVHEGRPVQSISLNAEQDPFPRVQDRVTAEWSHYTCSPVSRIDDRCFRAGESVQVRGPETTYIPYRPRDALQADASFQDSAPYAQLPLQRPINLNSTTSLMHREYDRGYY